MDGGTVEQGGAVASAAALNARDVVWWKRGIVYQVYPRSFQDTNGDGVGDLQGIRQRLPYLAWLGVDAVWISPIFTSPMHDFGYDVADYCGIAPLFGTIEDFDAMLADAHRLGLKVILDFVPNHTSTDHPWFVESRSSRDNPKRDWYIWRDRKPDGSPPNNWISNFGGSAWEYDEHTGQCYYHAFLREQADLNWRNPEVRKAMFDALRFWLDRGVDGFRVDVIWHMIKDAEFRDNPPNPSFHHGQAEIDSLLQIHSTDQPEVHEVIAEMRQVLAAYPERVLIGEIYLPLAKLMTYYGEDLKGADLPFNFQLIHAAWNARTLAALVRDYDAALPNGGWGNWVLGNHDQHRIGTRIGAAQARVAGMMLLTMRGTPTMYYGDEIGMLDGVIPPEAVQDPWEKQEPGLNLGRDPERTPMQWDGSTGAGFSTAKPWLPIAEGAANTNVEQLKGDPASILAMYRRLIELRRSHAALSIGSFQLMREADDLFAYQRAHGDERFLVFLNLADHERTEDLKDLLHTGKIALSTTTEREGEQVRDQVVLGPNEGLLIQCDN